LYYTGHVRSIYDNDDDDDDDDDESAVIRFQSYFIIFDRVVITGISCY